jgi:N-glycosylase/DNA lyase
MSQSSRSPDAGSVLQGAISAPEFDLSRSMDCGQVFGWHSSGGTYWGMIGDSAVALRQSGGIVHFSSDRPLPPSRISSYLGLDQDFDVIRREISRDAFMQKVMEEVKGLRILRQDAWPCLCSYILSSNNRVERIDALVKRVASTYGRHHEVEGRVVHSLPEPGDLAACSESDVRSCGTGFRAPYLVEAAAMVSGGEVDLKAIDDLDEGEGRDRLKRLPGVGDKVADCVLLFAYSKYAAFPVDVWIKRVMERVYFHSCDVSPMEIRRFARAYFGPYAGYAQEYMYSYARSSGLEW